jgi:hypothetical protein
MGASTMTKGGSKKMKIKFDVASGKLMKVVDEKGEKATRVNQTEVGRIYRSLHGFKHIGVILHAESSPGCMYVIIADRVHEIRT